MWTKTRSSFVRNVFFLLNFTFRGRGRHVCRQIMAFVNLRNWSPKRGNHAIKPSSVGCHFLARKKLLSHRHYNILLLLRWNRHFFLFSFKYLSVFLTMWDFVENFQNLGNEFGKRWHGHRVLREDHNAANLYSNSKEGGESLSLKVTWRSLFYNRWFCSSFFLENG